MQSENFFLKINGVVQIDIWQGEKINVLLLPRNNSFPLTNILQEIKCLPIKPIQQ